MRQRITFWLSVLSFRAGLLPIGVAAQVQEVTQAQLTMLAPAEQDLQGFIRMRPAGEGPSKEVFQNGRWIRQELPTAPILDKVQLNRDTSDWIYGWAPLTTVKGCVSHLQRDLYSFEGIYHIEIHISLCPSPGAARDELAMIRGTSSGHFEPGSFTSAAGIGDESFFLSGANFKHLLFRTGSLVVRISGSPSYAASRNKTPAAFPPSAVDAVAYQILLRASRQASLTGVSAQAARLAVNGKTLSGSPLLIGSKVYVPVVEFARAMGLESRWDDKTGTLTLSGPNQKAILLAAGSTSTTVGGRASAPLAVPVLKEANQPVMVLEDLLTLVKGKIISRKGDTVEVKT